MSNLVNILETDFVTTSQEQLLQVILSNSNSKADKRTDIQTNRQTDR